MARACVWCGVAFRGGSHGAARSYLVSGLSHDTRPCRCLNQSIFGGVQTPTNANSNISAQDARLRTMGCMLEYDARERDVCVCVCARASVCAGECVWVWVCGSGERGEKHEKHEQCSLCFSRQKGTVFCIRSHGDRHAVDTELCETGGGREMPFV